MHAVLVSVTINDGEAATKYLRGEIVPRVKQAPGFVAGYWVRVENGDQGRGTIVFESEDAARAAASTSSKTPVAQPHSTRSRGRGRRERLRHASRRRTSRVVLWMNAVEGYWAGDVAGGSRSS